jgi:hypothetical protein
MDTYKINTVANSTSTMHTIASNPITLDCFEIDDFDGSIKIKDNRILASTEDAYINIQNYAEEICWMLEQLRLKYLDLKKTNPEEAKKYWKELIRWLPSGWLQKRTMTMNYEVMRNICAQRSGHKLSEWQTFIDFAHTLPYADEFIFYN